MIWYPYAQMKLLKQPIKIKSAKGIYLIDENNNELIDSISSWWSVIHGYSNEELNAVIKDQVDKFSHVMLGGLTHDPVINLTNKLKSILPKDLDYVFYSDSGSVGVEVSLKMAIQYYSNMGNKDKIEFVSLTHSYHGDTFKAMSISDDPEYHEAFPFKDGIYHVNPNKDELESLFKKHSDTIAAFIVEPILQGAGGMRIYDEEFLFDARELCDKYNVLLIFDEVATGFGRTGNMFVSNIVCPDIIVLGKALTAGYIGHAATVANKKVYDGFISDSYEKALMHGPTFMGNPIACRVALKSIEIFEENNYLDKIKNIEYILNEEFKSIKSDKIKEIRVIGAMGCIELKDSKDMEGFSEFALERGVFNRPFIKYMYIMPPYIISDEELRKIISVFKEWFER